MDVETLRVRDVVRDVVTEVAPEELPLLAGLERFDDAAVVRRLSGRDRRREALGFGLGEVAALVTPVVWLAVDQAAQQIVGTWVENGISKANAVLRRLFRRPASEPVAIPPLTREQMRLVRETVLKVAAQRGLESDRADVLADAVVTRLVLVEVEPEEASALPDANTPNRTAATEPPGRPDAQDRPEEHDRTEAQDGPDTHDGPGPRNGTEQRDTTEPQERPAAPDPPEAQDEPERRDRPDAS